MKFPEIPEDEDLAVSGAIIRLQDAINDNTEKLACLDGIIQILWEGLNQDPKELQKIKARLKSALEQEQAKAIESEFDTQEDIDRYYNYLAKAQEDHEKSLTRYLEQDDKYQEEKKGRQ